MRIIGPPTYKPNPPYTLPEATVAVLRERRLADAKRRRLENARREREARLRCPECGDSLKVRYKGAWACQHCLCQMILPGVDRLWFRSA